MKAAGWVWLALLASGCRSLPGLREAAVLDERDFVYAIALSPDATKAAFTHLGAKSFQLGLWSLKPLARVADVAITPNAFDVEGLAFSPDGEALCAASRDGVLRCYGAKDGAALGAYAADGPLVSVAFHPGGRAVLLGGAGGLVTVLEWPGLRFASDARVHGAEVRAIAVARDGRVFTGGWDKRIAVSELVERSEEVRAARVAFVRKEDVALVAGLVNGQPVRFALDARVPCVVLTSQAARAAGVEPSRLTETVAIPTALGSTLARVARGQRLDFKALSVPFDIAVCDACVPRGAQGVLGAPFSGSFDVLFDEEAGQAVLTARPGVAAGPARKVLALEERARFAFDAYVNDFTVDREGRVLGVAFSEQKAERTRELYEREKRREPEPRRALDFSAMVDARTGQVTRAWHAHLGIVATAAISPDGKTLVTGGWDRAVYLFGESSAGPRAREELGWSLRRARFSEDGRLVAVGAWTPQGTGGGRGAPSALLYAPVPGPL